MNILLAEDAQETRETLRNIISFTIDKDINIFEAENGVEAFEIIKNNEIDILLTDIMMPLMNGFELITKVRTNESSKDIFIAAITGLSTKDDIKKVFSCGADYYISKPIQKDDIVARLKLIYKLVSKDDKKSPKILRDSFNPFDVPTMMNYHTIFSILQEDDLYQIIHHITLLHPEVDKIKLKDFITLLLKSYKSLDKEFDGAFEMMLEPSTEALFMSCTNLNFINAIKNYENKLSSRIYEMKYMPNSITIKIPTKSN